MTKQTFWDKIRVQIQKFVGWVVVAATWSAGHIKKHLPKLYPDGILLTAALVVVAATLFVARMPLEPNQDPLARANVVVLCLILVSMATSLCEDVHARAWGVCLGIAGIGLLGATIYFGNPGGWSSVLDVIT